MRIRARSAFTGHIGPGASALVDGQLDAAEEERAWRHVLGCPGCRRLVEHEGWTKRQLGSLSDPVEHEASGPSGLLLGSLYSVHDWAAVDAIEEQHWRQRRLVGFVFGGGAVAAAVVGVFALSTPPVGVGEPRVPVAPADVRSSMGDRDVSPTVDSRRSQPVFANHLSR